MREQLCLQNSLRGLRVSQCQTESRLEKGCISVWRTGEEEREQAGRLRQVSAEGCEDLMHTWRCNNCVNVQQAITKHGQASRASPSSTQCPPVGLTCCSSEWNGRHINIMRKRNARQEERNKEFIWAQNWARGDTQLLPEMTRKSAWGCPDPTAG